MFVDHQLKLKRGKRYEEVENAYGVVAYDNEKDYFGGELVL